MKPHLCVSCYHVLIWAWLRLLTTGSGFLSHQLTHAGITLRRLHLALPPHCLPWIILHHHTVLAFNLKLSGLCFISEVFLLVLQLWLQDFLEACPMCWECHCASSGCPRGFRLPTHLTCHEVALHTHPFRYQMAGTSDAHLSTSALPTVFCARRLR